MSIIYAFLKQDPQHCKQFGIFLLLPLFCQFGKDSSGTRALSFFNYMICEETMCSSVSIFLIPKDKSYCCPVVGMPAVIL